VLAGAGVASRRASEALIQAGRVQVNGAVVTMLGTRIDPGRDVVHVDGERLATATGLVHLSLHKPRGVVSSMQDERGRPSVGELVAGKGVGLFHVGRLDADTEGLLLVMNDGPLAHRLLHPSYAVPKVYLAEVPGPVSRAVQRQVRDGVELDDGPVLVDRFRVLESVARRALVEVVVHEGRPHVVRRLLEAVGHPVQRLVRTAVGPVLLGDMRPGRSRPLSRQEVSALYRCVDL
jgi:23S rRNA pseudouridine2605 synthase